eukprot:461006-Prorocentrum_minimum.AAC.2
MQLARILVLRSSSMPASWSRVRTQAVAYGEPHAGLGLYLFIYIEPHALDFCVSLVQWFVYALGANEIGVWFLTSQTSSPGGVEPCSESARKHFTQCDDVLAQLL